MTSAKLSKFVVNIHSGKQEFTPQEVIDKVRDVVKHQAEKKTKTLNLV